MSSRAVKCRYCPAFIIWLKTPLGRSMPVDAETVGFGDWVFDPNRGHRAHWATCQNPPPRKR
jgi:hypothetical protein